MARIAGVNIPTGKRVPIALTYITGIGRTTAEEICSSVKIDATRRVNELSDAEVRQSGGGDEQHRQLLSYLTCPNGRRSGGPGG